MSARGQDTLDFQPGHKRGLLWILPEDIDEAVGLLKSDGYHWEHGGVLEKEFWHHPNFTLTELPPRVGASTSRRSVTTRPPSSVAPPTSGAGRGKGIPARRSPAGQALRPRVTTTTRTTTTTTTTKPPPPPSRSFTVRDGLDPVYEVEVKGFPSYNIFNVPEPFDTIEKLSERGESVLLSGPRTVVKGQFSILPQDIQEAVDLLQSAGYQWTNPREL
jgi:hypothetical protein